MVSQQADGSLGTKDEKEDPERDLADDSRFLEMLYALCPGAHILRLELPPPAMGNFMAAVTICSDVRAQKNKV